MPDKPSRFPLWLKALVVLAALAGAFYFALVYSRPTALVEAVISGDAIDAKPGSVTVKEEYLMQMKTQIGGRVLNKGYHLDPGMKVKEGDLLVHLDTGDTEIEIEAVQNDYNAVKQRIELGSAQKYVLESAQSDFTNTERLFKLGQISSSDYEKARRVVETAEQQLALEKVMNEQNLKTDENTLKAKRREMDKMTITAPFDGQISEVFAHPGDLIQPDSPIVSIITTTRLVQAKISEEDFANIKEGQDATVIFLPYGEFEYKGVVQKILPVADPLTQRHLVDLEMKDTNLKPDQLIPGITGEVSIVVGRHHANAIIPRRAVLNQSVYVVKDGKVERRKVKAGFEWLTGVEILEGLEPGEMVITEELENFSDGQSVRAQELPSDVFSKKK
jgi:RND family efflux transporter MFP subunit